MSLGEAGDIVRRFACMKGDQDITALPGPRFSDGDAMPEVAEDSAPAGGRDAVALARPDGRGGDESEFQRTGHAGYCELIQGQRQEPL